MRVCLSFTSKNTGGEYVHKLTISEMPSHRHFQKVPDGSEPNQNQNWLKVKKENGTESGGFFAADWASTGLGDSVNTSYSGDGQSHNNIMPYIVCYFWIRTA